MTFLKWHVIKDTIFFLQCTLYYYIVLLFKAKNHFIAGECSGAWLWMNKYIEWMQEKREEMVRTTILAQRRKKQKKFFYVLEHCTKAKFMMGMSLKLWNHVCTVQWKVVWVSYLCNTFLCCWNRWYYDLWFSTLVKIKQQKDTIGKLTKWKVECLILDEVW